MKMLLRRIDGGGTSGDFSLSLLDAMTRLRNAWNFVTPQAIANCFRKAGMASCQPDVEDEESTIGYDLAQQLVEKNIVDENFDVNTFVTVDGNLAVAPSADSQAIIRAEEQDPISDEEDDCGCQVEEVSSTFALVAVATLRNFFMQQDKDLKTAPLLANIERNIEDVVQSRRVQTSITGYFNPL
jgi:hypothetical protein